MISLRARFERMASHTELRVKFDRSRTRSSPALVRPIRSLGLGTQAVAGIIVAAVCVFVILVALGCQKKNQAVPDVTLTIIDQSWVDKESQAILSEELKRFTDQTGIRVQVMPAPEVAVDQLATWRNLLESGAKVPDV